jgi:hypothetical protein
MLSQKLPILIIGYNRPELLEARLNEISQIQFPKLYISLDATQYGQLTQNLEIISALQNNSNSFHLEVNLESKNLGLTRHVTKAISNVLKNEEAVIVLEDDISLSNETYSAFCDANSRLVAKNVLGIVCGFSPLVQPSYLKRNYWRISKYFSVWGWVATRKNWEPYSYDITGLDIQKTLSYSQTWRTLSKFQKSVWLARFRRVQLDPLHTWDIQMQFCSFANNYMNMLPLFTLVGNNGFNDKRATHTRSKKPRWLKIPEAKSFMKPNKELNSCITKAMDFLDSNTFIGDSKIFYIWSRKIKKILLVTYK